jgi:hypothetical protein
MKQRLCLLAGLCLVGSGCAHGDPRTTSPQPAPSSDLTEAYLARLLTGDAAALRASFAGPPAVDDPLGGRVRGAGELDRFVAERHAWLAERRARIVPARTTRVAGRSLVESVLELRQGSRDIALPIAIVGDVAADGRLRAVRVYHSSWPLEGRHHVRPPLLPADRGPQLDGAVADYQRALAAGDVDAIVATFAPDGYFREPSGEPYVHRGRAALLSFMRQILGAGGIGIEHATVTDDGVVCAIEFNAVRFGRRALQPQAGLAVYERGPSGKLHAARIYDDVNVEALVAP